MSSVGIYLRELRQRRGVSLEEIARTTRVAQRYLESIEADDFTTLPSPVFTRGFIRAYCQVLNEPPDEALAAYDGREADAPAPAPSAARAAGGARPTAAAPRAGATPLRTAAAASRTAEGEPRGKGAVLVSFVLLVVLGVALLAVTLVIHPRDRGERVVASPRPEARPVRPAEDPAPAPTASAPPPAPGPPASPAPTPAPIPAPAPVTAPPASGPAPPPAASAPPATAPTPVIPPAPPPPSAPAATTPPALRPATPTMSSAPAAPAPAASAPRSSAASPGASGTPPANTPAPVAPSLDAAVGSVISPYRLVARTSEATWIRVRTEDGRSSEETVPPGEVREWVSNRPFVVTVGNAGGVAFELNGRALPPLGPRGAVIPRIVLPPEPR